MAMSAGWRVSRSVVVRAWWSIACSSAAKLAVGNEGRIRKRSVMELELELKVKGTAYVNFKNEANVNPGSDWNEAS